MRPMAMDADIDVFDEPLLLALARRSFPGP
jgi:hypothetical protein